MLLLLLGVLLFGTICTVSFLITYWVFNMINQAKGGEEPNINNTIMVQFTTLVQNIVNVTGDMLSIVSGKFFGIVSNIQTNLRIYLQISIFSLIVLSYTAEKEMFLTKVDSLWRCGLHPFFNSILFTILQAGRLLYGGVVPVYNFETLVVKQLITGTQYSVFLCASKSLFESLVILLNVVISLFQSVTIWTGLGLELSMENNIVFNEFNIVKLVLNIQRLVLKQSEVTGCACGGLVDAFEFIFIAFRQDELAFAVSHFVNLPISSLQTLLQVIPPWSKLPYATDVVNHLNGFIYYLSVYMDQVAMKWILHTISLFDDKFKLDGVPTEFAFTIIGRLSMTAVHVIWMLFRSLLAFSTPFSKIIVPAIPFSDTFINPVNALTEGDYMLRAMSLDQAIEQFNLASIGFTDLLSWFCEITFEVGRSIAVALKDGSPISILLPQHKHITCNDQLDNVFDNYACATREFLTSFSDSLYILYSLIIEIIFKTLVNQEEGIISTIQRYDGISFPRNVALTCEYRASIKYDLTAKECRCDPGFGTFRKVVIQPGYPFGKPYYDPYCGQPNLQVNLFNKLERSVGYLTSDSPQIVSEVVMATARFYVEPMRLSLKAILNIGNMVKGNYFEQKVNCGYGVSSIQLRSWYNSRDPSTTFDEKIEQARDKYTTAKGELCDDRKGNLAYFDDQLQDWICKQIDESIFDIMCMGTANPDGKRVTRNENTVTLSVPKCRDVNKAGCECNPLLSNACNGHKTWNYVLNVFDSDDPSIKNENSCTDEYAGGTWVLPLCKVTFINLHVDNIQKKKITSYAKCQEYLAFNNIRESLINDIEFTPGYCIGQKLNGEDINPTTESNCIKKTQKGKWYDQFGDTNQCSCIRNFPDTMMEIAQDPFDNILLNKLRSPEVSVHWCNTFWAEWTLYAVQQAGKVIEQAAGVFHPAYDTDTDSGNDFCETKSFTIVDINVLRFPRYKFIMDEAQYKRLQITYTENSCSLYGTTDFICSTGLTIRSSINVIINEIRMIVMSFNKIIDADFKGIKLAISERVCDVARVLAAVSSVLPSLLDDALTGTEIQEGLSKAIYSFFHIVTSGLDIISVVLTFIDDLVSNRLNFLSGDSFPVFDLLFTILNIFINEIRLILQGLGDLLNAIHSGAGEGLYTVDTIIDILQVHLLNEAVVEIVGLVIKIFFELFEFLTSGNIAGGIGNFFIDIFYIIKKIVLLMVKKIGTVMSLLLDLMGPAGDLIRQVGNTICGVIESIMCALNDIGINLGSCDLGCGDGFRRRHLFSSGTEDSKFQDIVWHVSNDIPWNGTSNCDMFIHSYKNYKWDDLRPIEHIELLNCIEQRYIMRKVNEHYNVSLPEDLLYNWQRKWELAYMFAHAGVIYVEHKLGSLTTKQMLHKMQQKNIHFSDWLPLFNSLHSAVANTFTFQNMYDGIEYAFKQYDPDIENGGTPVSSLYRLYSISGKAFRKVHKHVRKQNLRHQFKVLYATLKTHAPAINISSFQLPQHVYHGLDTYNKLRSAPVSSSKRYAKNIILKAAGVVTDITPCSEKEDTYVCLNCVVLDNFLNVVIKDGIQMSFYYENIYAGITIPSFIDHWTNSTQVAWRREAGKSMGKGFGTISNKLFDPGSGSKSPIYSKFATYISTLSINTTAGSQVESSYDPNEDPVIRLQRSRLKMINNNTSTQTISYRDRVLRDWYWLVYEQGYNPFYNHPESETRPSLAIILVDFIIADYYDYVPFFERSLRYYLWQPIQDCPAEKIYCTYNTFEERQQLITNAIIYTLVTILVFYVSEYILGIPLFTSMTPYFLFIFAFIYMYTVYIYTYKCIPSVPNCLLDDLYAYIHDKLFPQCFCVYLPGLSKNCNPDTCFLCGRTTEFAECVAEIPLINTMGIAWAPVFAIRTYFPQVLVYLYKTSPFSWVFRNYESLIEITQGIIENTEIRQVEMDCLTISYFDLVLAGVILWLCSQLMSLVAPIIVRSVQHTLNLFLIYTTMIYSMIISLEIQTVTVKED